MLTSGAALYDGYAIMDGGDVVKMEKSFDIKNNKMVLRVLAEDALWVCDYELGAICGAHSDGSFFAYYGTQKAAGVEWAKDWTDIVGIVKDSWNLVAVKKDGTMLCHGKEGKQFNLSGVRLFEDIDSFIENHDARIAKLKDEEKAHKRAAIEKVIEQKKAELASLKGLFTGARRKQLEAEIAELNNKLQRI